MATKAKPSDIEEEEDPKMKLSSAETCILPPTRTSEAIIIRAIKPLFTHRVWIDNVACHGIEKLDVFLSIKFTLSFAVEASPIRVVAGFERHPPDHVHRLGGDVKCTDVDVFVEILQAYSKEEKGQTLEPHRKRKKYLPTQ